jgi:exosome complex component RRP41
MGNTKVICTVTGPSEQKPQGGSGGGGGPRGGNRDEAEVRVEISVAGFSGVERKRRARNDKFVPPPHLSFLRIHLQTFCTWDI